MNRISKTIRKIFLVSLVAFICTTGAFSETMEFTLNQLNDILTESRLSDQKYRIFESTNDPLTIVITDTQINGDLLKDTISSLYTSRPVTLDLHYVKSVNGSMFFEYVHANIVELVLPNIWTGITYFTKLEKFNIPQCMTNIKYQSFSRIPKIREIVIPEGSLLYEIGWNSFKGFENLESISIPPSCRKIGKEAFSGCKKLKSINLSGVETLESSAFSNCESLESVTIGSSLKELGNAFTGCTNLKEITINNPNIILNNDFSLNKCPNVEKINLPKDANYVIVDGLLMDSKQTTVYYMLANSKKAEIKIPDTVNKICAGAFSSNCGVKKITNIPDLKNQDLAFGNSSSIEEVSFRPGVKYIALRAFVNCKNLKKFTFPEGVEYVGKNQFSGCEKLESIYIPEGLANTDSYNFYYSFAECTSLKDVRLPTDRINVDPCMFYKSGLETIDIPDNFQKIGSLAFSECKNLKNIKLPKNLKELNMQTFKGCTSLETITLPDGVETIGSEAFANCTALKTLVLPETVKKIDSQFISGCTELYEVNIPVSVKIIKSSIFE